ncbi:siderophore ABC transporter substrate-binding protein [Corynebacterium uterequi]|uniref:ABC-type enterochelin transport system, periplasmic component n=1 Tax=Corynebacterium uterequi TaxID=1072256 RepID=A0A0G3HFC3_9CORY|nr:ABC transporter substrate-binding protein [Corynebacterium uterequi]AKK10613.1 ABC-type enterochelin transport system, periplasmic component [Corynebacterium uterequi]
MVNMKRAVIALLAATSLGLTACQGTADQAGDATSSATSAASEAASDAKDTAAGTIEVEDNHGVQTVPADPKAVVALDNRSFEILADWGVELVAAPKKLIPPTIEEYKTDDSIVDLGNHREPDLEALAAAQPDLIVSGQRFQKYYEDLGKLAPEAAIVEFEPKKGEPLDEELRRHAEGLGKVFGKEAEAEKLIADFDAALERAKAAYNGEDTVMAVNVSGGDIGFIAPSVGRTYGPLFDLLGLKPALEVPEGSSNHKGDDISVETIAESNPTWLLVLDRDAGTSKATEAGFKNAEQVLKEAEALANVTAVKEGNVYIAPSDTYTNESIITYTEILNAIADQFEAAK